MEAGGDLADRTCIVTREVRDESALIRFVPGPSGEVVPDLARRLPGRGVWVSLGRSKVEDAQRKGLFSRSLKSEVSAPRDLAETVGRLLRGQATSYLSLARKAGEAVSGFDRCGEMLSQRRARLLLHAVGAAADGCRKLRALAGEDVEIIEIFTPAELDLAFGRSPVVHAAVAKGGIAEKLLAAARRVEIYEAH